MNEKSRSLSFKSNNFSSIYVHAYIGMRTRARNITFFSGQTTFFHKDKKMQKNINY